jgi:hypothetical protein
MLWQALTEKVHQLFQGLPCRGRVGAARIFGLNLHKSSRVNACFDQRARALRDRGGRHVQGHARLRRRPRHIVETTRAEAGRKSVHAMKKVMGALNYGPTI